MTQKEWNEMSNPQRHEYLSDGEIEIKKQLAADAKAKVNDVKVRAYYSAFCRDVQISHWHESNTDAMEEATNFMKELAT